MKVTPLDIRRKEFKRSMRGYSDEEVDIFLDEVADEFERLFQENIEMHDRVQRLEEQIAGHAQIKDALEKTLISAQLQSDEMKANARKEGELVLRDAELKARHIVNDSYGETQRVQQALIQLKHLEEDFRFKFRSLLEGHLKLLNEAPITVPGAEAAPASELVPEAEAEALLAAPAPLAAPESEVSHAIPSPPTQMKPVDSSLAEEPAASWPAAEEPEAGPLAAAAASFGETSAEVEDDAPTEETEETEAELGAAELVAELAGSSGEGPAAAAVAAVAAVPDVASAVSEEPAADIVAEPTDTGTEGVEEEPSARGFFFGRQLDDIDDTFPGADEKTEKGRDFEW